MTENLSRITISIHQPHRCRCTSHDLVLIFPIWSCMSCNKLLQSHLLRHFHYLNGISLVCIWLLYVLYLVVCMSWKLYALVSCWLYASDGWPEFQSIFDSLQSIATDDEKHYQCQNIVLNFKKTGPLFLEFNWWIQSLFAPMGETWLSVLTEAWKYLTGDNSTFRESSSLRTRSSFKRFLYCGSKVLGVVQSKIFCVEVSKTACRFSLTCVVRRFLYLDTDFVNILFLVPQCYLFNRRTFFAYLKSLIKISKGFKKWNCRNCFRKTGLNTSF